MSKSEFQVPTNTYDYELEANIRPLHINKNIEHERNESPNICDMTMFNIPCSYIVFTLLQYV